MAEIMTDNLADRQHNVPDVCTEAACRERPLRRGKSARNKCTSSLTQGDVRNRPASNNPPGQHQPTWTAADSRLSCQPRLSWAYCCCDSAGNLRARCLIHMTHIQLLQVRSHVCYRPY